jgi:histidinol-phosphatase (PHP family)
MALLADSHVHTEWSWDAAHGSMERSCARAVELGLGAVAFTEHVDHSVWAVDVADLEPGDHLLTVTDPDGRVRPPAFDPDGYLAAVERCRERFPGLRILSGLELGEPHLHRDAVARVLAAGPYDRVLGSLHCLPDDGDQVEPPGLFGMRARPPHEVVRTYLATVAEMVAADDTFSVLAHVDYPVRSWPRERAGPFDPRDFEEEFRHTLHVTAESGRALEVSTVVPLHEPVLRWWREVGGEAITFGSDAHEPQAVARGFREAAHLAEAHGFRPGRDPHDLWGRA